MKFNSQRCTTREQSERLLSLGLKKETADMCWIAMSGGHYIYATPWSSHSRGKDIPAWSLHRLIEMALRYVLICGISFTFNEDAYEKVIRIIDHQIKEGNFPKEYLEEKQWKK